MEIGKGVDSRNLRSMGKPEVENHATNLGAILGRRINLSSGSVQVWPTQNYSEKERLERGMQRTKFYNEYVQ